MRAKGPVAILVALAMLLLSCARPSCASLCGGRMQAMKAEASMRVATSHESMAAGHCAHAQHSATTGRHTVVSEAAGPGNCPAPMLCEQTLARSSLQVPAPSMRAPATYAVFAIAIPERSHLTRSMWLWHPRTPPPLRATVPSVTALRTTALRV